ncbi:MAG: hypothetical protein WCP28_00690 [Actinomycetes bacterium]
MTWLKLVAASAASAVLVVLAGAGAQAGSATGSPTDPASSPSANQLQVTVGKTVALTTDQNGNQTPLNLLLINGQVSGQGSGQVNIPTSPTNSKTVDVSSSGGQVQNFFSLAGTYGGQFPVTVATQATVNGQKIDPDKGFGLNGDVEVSYVFTNHTSRQQTITYKNIYGVTTSTTVDVPVPFGSVFTVAFGNGWRIEDPGTMSLKTTPDGSKLSATVVLFPIIKGVGGTTQTVTIKAKADNANLPATNATIVPIDLSTYMGGLALDLVPGVNAKLLNPANSAISEALGQVVGVAQLISGYTAGYQSLATDYIDPVVKQVEKINVDPDSLTTLLTQLSKGLTQLSTLMSANSSAQKYVAGLLNTLSKSMTSDLVPLAKWLGKVAVELGPAAADAAKALASLNTVFGRPEFGQLPANVGVVQPVCDGVSATTAYYGYVNQIPVVGPVGSPGAAAVADAIKSGKKQHWVADLKTLQSQLDAQSTGNLLSKDLWLAAGLLPEKWTKIKPFLRDSACTTVLGITSKTLVPLAKVWDPAKMTELAALLTKLSVEVQDPAVQKGFTVALQAIDTFAKVLSNTACKPGDIMNPIVAALKKYGVAGIKSQLKPIAKQILSHCGLSQLVGLLSGADQEVAKVSAALAPVVTAATAEVPIVVNAVDKAKGAVGLGGKFFDSIPGLGRKIADAITGLGSKYGDKADGGLAKVSDFAAQLQATLVAMNARTAAGDGAPYGNATGPSNQNTQTITAYQITMQEASPYVRDWTISIVMAAISLLIAIGGTAYFYRRRRAK